MQADKLSVIVRDILAEYELELESLDIVGGAGQAVLRVIVDGDGPDGRGPLLDDITTASQAISRALDDEPATGSRPFTLEIGSRGVSRPLTEAKHWRRNTGRLVRVERDGHEPVTGRIQETDETTATLEVQVPPVKGAKGPKKPTTRIDTITLAEVRKAVIQVELTKMRAEDLVEEELLDATDDTDNTDNTTEDFDSAPARPAQPEDLEDGDGYRYVRAADDRA